MNNTNPLASNDVYSLDCVKRLNFKLYEKLVNLLSTSNVELHMNPVTLITSSRTTRRHEKIIRTGHGVPPRPPNCFFLYRRNKPKYGKTKQSRVSKEIGKNWRNETEEVRNFYRELAIIAKELHSCIHVGFKYKRNLKNKRKNFVISSQNESFAPSSSSPSS